MKNLFVDCSNGISGDMLLAALIDSGVCRNVVHSQLSCIDFKGNYKLLFQEGKSHGIRGIRSCVEISNIESFSSKWIDIRNLIEKSSLGDEVKRKTLMVFNILAEAEATVHGVSIEDVCFHEIGDLDSIIDVVCVCAAINSLKPHKIFFVSPPTGFGKISTKHGILPVPVPTVLEIARRFEIPLLFSDSSENGELTTPTGIALLAAFSNCLQRPTNNTEISNIGIGLGQKEFGRPNFLRVFTFFSTFDFVQDQTNIQPIYCQRIVCQETWLDDATPEDIASLTAKLRAEGAIEVGCQTIHMKKGRQGVSIKAIMRPEEAINLRVVWFSQSPTLGFREWEEDRWVLPRRRGKCITSLGEIMFKQIAYPEGQFIIKPEHNELVRLSDETGRSISQIRKEISMELSDFIPTEDWSC